MFALDQANWRAGLVLFRVLAKPRGKRPTREARGFAVWALASRVTQAVFQQIVAWDVGWYGHHITIFKLRILQKVQGVLHQHWQRAPMPSNDNDPVKLNPIRGWHVWAGEKEDAQRVLEGVELRFPPLNFLHKRARAAVTDPREGLGTLGQHRPGRDIVLRDGHQGATNTSMSIWHIWCATAKSWEHVKPPLPRRAWCRRTIMPLKYKANLSTKRRGKRDM